MIVTKDGWLHSWTPVQQNLAYAAFAAASAGGGTAPQWTEAADPRSAVPPPDAAGTLWRLGDMEHTPPTIARVAELFGDLVCDGMAATPLGAYFSSGGRGVFLLAVAGHCYVVVGRADEVPRYGASEANIAAMGCDVTMFAEPAPFVSSVVEVAD